MPPDVIGKISATAGVRQLILSHRRPETLSKEAATQKIIESEFKGPLLFANDLDCFPLWGRHRPVVVCASELARVASDHLPLVAMVDP